jgi:hypothetical protein
MIDNLFFRKIILFSRNIGNFFGKRLSFSSITSTTFANFLGEKKNAKFFLYHKLLFLMKKKPEQDDQEDMPNVKLIIM